MSDTAVANKPKFNAPEPVKAAGFIKPSERASGGLRRFKIRGELPTGPQPVKYIAAKTQAEAESLYRTIVPQEALKALSKDKDGNIIKVDMPLHLVVTALPD